MSRQDLESLRLTGAMLLPGRRYRWRVAQGGTNSKASELSEETSFATGDYPVEIVPFDLSAYFNRDVSEPCVPERSPS